MRPNSLLILVLAIVLGGIAAFLVRNWLLSRTQVASSETVMVVAAAKPLPFGTQLTDDNVEEMPWAAKSLPAGAFTSKAALFKEGRRISLASIQQHEPVLTSKITGPGERASLSTLLDKDKRAITIRVDDVRGVAGFILPNDRVDVVLIRTLAEGNVRHDVSDILLQDVKVIAVDQIASEQKDRPTIAKAVTLEVTPYQAQKISLATNIGHLSLILRKAGDSNLVADRQITETDLSANESAVRIPPPPPAPSAPAQVQAAPPPPTYSNDAVVTIIRNLRGQDYKVVRESR